MLVFANMGAVPHFSNFQGQILLKYISSIIHNLQRPGCLSQNSGQTNADIKANWAVKNSKRLYLHGPLKDT